MPKRILVCTVGGSIEPILFAIRAIEPVHIVFLCTADMPETEQKGSIEEVRTICAQLDLPTERVEQVVVAADDPDEVFNLALEAIDRVRARVPSGSIIADYTGGTKSMSAGLLQAALERPGVRVQIVSGKRASKVKVLAGSEKVFELGFDAVLASRDLERAARAWEGFAYEEAALLLERYMDEDEGTVDDLPARLALQVRTVHGLSRGFAAWDRFDHAMALRELERFAHRPDITARLPALRRLAGEQARVTVDDKGYRKSPPPSEPVILLDLWLNALRCARRARYDDAVARCYRLVEATAQWKYHTVRGIDTSAVDPAKTTSSKIRKRFEKQEPGRNLELGLLAAWDCYGEVIGKSDPLYLALKERGQGASAEKPREALKDWTSKRNYSLLAHGFVAVAREDWKPIEAWCERYLVPHLRASCAELGALPQFPTSPELTSAP